MKTIIIFILLAALILVETSFAASFITDKRFNITVLQEVPEFKRTEFNIISRSSSSPSLGRGEASIRRRGIKPFIAPTLLIAGGTALHFSTGLKIEFQEWAQKNISYSGHADDYLQYAPLAVVYGLNATGIKGKNNFGNRSAIVFKSLLLNDFMVSRLKKWTNEIRPNGYPRAFPSGHTSVAFAMAHFMHKEYGEQSIWYSLGAYSCAATVGIMRVSKNAHWISDVAAGAGFGMLSTELVYLTHLYKWDNEHVKNFDIFPWRSNRQSGLAIVYTF